MTIEINKYRAYYYCNLSYHYPPPVLAFYPTTVLINTSVRGGKGGVRVGPVAAVPAVQQ